MADGPLLLDLGNRRLKLRVDGEPSEAFAWPEEGERTRLAKRLEALEGRPLVIASSSPLGLDLMRSGPLAGRVLRVVGADDVPLERTTTGTGVDRLLAAWWAHREAGGAACIADCGSAFTVDFVDAAGRFRGGAIGPGLTASEQALRELCPHLAPPDEDDSAGIPDDTGRATAAGTRRALAAALDGLAEQWELAAYRETGADGPLPDAARAMRFLTGGDAPRLAPLMLTWRPEEDVVLRALEDLAGVLAGE